MTFKQNLKDFYMVLPTIFVVDNKIGLSLSLLIGTNTIKFKIKGEMVQFPKSKFITFLYLLNCLSYTKSYSINSDKILKISFDKTNQFEIPLQNLTFEDSNLIELLHYGIRYGSNFITNDFSPKELRDLTFKISSLNNRKTITTYSGITFFLDSIHPGNTIFETFIKNIHLINSKIDWENKIVVDVGAECGDTPLYFASMGAKVFAFEALKKHYDFMMDNLKLNSKLSEKITPIHSAIGKDGPLKFFIDSDNDIGGTLGASYEYNNQNSNFKYEIVNGFSLSSARKKFQINHIDLLKMDCKGCEFSLTDDDLKNIHRVKIEYSIHKKTHRLENLLKILEKNGFSCVIFRVSDTSRTSSDISGTIFGIRND